MNFIFEVIAWVLFIYGFLSLSQDIINEITYKKINHNMKIIVLAKELENNLDSFSSELANLKRRNSYKNILVVDLEENDNIGKILKKFDSEEVNVKVVNKDEGKEYIDNYFENGKISFF